MLEYIALDSLTPALARDRHFVVLFHDYVRLALLFLAFHAPQRAELPQDMRPRYDSDIRRANALRAVMTQGFLKFVSYKFTHFV